MKIYWGKYADDTDMNAPFQRVSTLCEDLEWGSSLSLNAGKKRPGSDVGGVRSPQKDAWKYPPWN